MSFKGFSIKVTKDKQLASQQQANEHTHVPQDQDSNKGKIPHIPTKPPATDQSDKDVQPNHNVPRPN